MDVSELVSQMHETLSAIHTTLASIDTKPHDARLDELERQRDSAISILQTNFEQEAEVLAQKRKAELDEIAERRRKEDEERERRRRLEDEQLAAQTQKEDQERQLRLHKETQNAEEETDDLMNQVEEEATRLVEDGKEKLRALEERRKEINRLIDEQLKAPLPSAPSRRRVSRPAGTGLPPVVAAESKIPVPHTDDEQSGNPGVKALEEDNESIVHVQQMGQPSGAVDTPRHPLPKPQSPSTAEVQSLEEREDGQVPLSVADSNEGDNEVPQQESADHGPKPDLERPELPSQESSAAEASPEDDSSDAEQQPSDNEEANEGDDGGKSVPRPSSILGSWGMTIKSLVTGHSASDESNALSSAQNNVINPEHDLEESTDVDGPTPTHDATSRSAAPSQEPESAGVGAGAVSENGLQGFDSPYSEDHFTMSGRQAIPGTITHGSDGSASEIIEPIPGTMTHGADHLSIERGDSVEDETPIAEKASDTLGGSTELDEPLHITTINGAATISDDAASPAEDTFSPIRTFLRSGTPKRLDEIDLTVESPSATEASAALDTQAVLDGSKLDQSEIHALLHSGAFTGHDKLRPRSASLSIQTGPAAEDLPVLDKMTSTDHPGTSVDDPVSISNQGHIENDHAGDDGAWSDNDSEAGYSSQDSSAEPESTANTSIESVLPASAGTDVGKSTRTGDEETSTNNPAAKSGGDGLQSRQDHIVEEESQPDESGSGPRSTHKPAESSYAAYPDHDDESAQQHYVPPLQGDGDSVDHNIHGEEGDGTLRVNDGRAHSPQSTTQLVLNNNPTGFDSGQSTPQTGSQPFMTPLATADFQTPIQFHDWGVNHGYGTGQPDDGNNQVGLEDQHATTVHGQDDLFEEDDRSDEESPELGLDSASDDGSVRQDQSTTPAHGAVAETVEEPKTPVTANNDDFHSSRGSDSIDRPYEQSKTIQDEAAPPSLERGLSISTGSRDEDTTATPVLRPRITPTSAETTPLTSPTPVTPTRHRGLANSRHNPDRPRTPDQQTGAPLQETPENPFAPVDVTNVPWNARRDSTPRSMRSQSTLSSSPSSPIHSSLPVDNQEPVIRDSWPTPTHDHLLLNGMRRSRNDSQLSTNGDFETFRYDSKPAAAPWPQREDTLQQGQSLIERTTPRRDSVASSSPGGLFQKMRSVFEPAAPNKSLPSSGRNSPVWTRVASSAPHSVSRRMSGDPSSPMKLTTGMVTRDGDGYDSASERRGGGFLAEDGADDAADEKSSLLHSSYAEEYEAN